jgi:hypothetical protein
MQPPAKRPYFGIISAGHLNGSMLIRDLDVGLSRECVTESKLCGLRLTDGLSFEPLDFGDGSGVFDERLWTGLGGNL